MEPLSLSPMEDEDEFGDLYTDVLLPISSEISVSQPPIFTSTASSANPPPNLAIQSDEEDVLYGASDPKFSISYHMSHQRLVPATGKAGNEGIPGVSSGTDRNSIDGDRVVEKDSEEEEFSRVSEKVDDIRVLGSRNEEILDEEARVLEDMETCEKSGIGEIKDVVYDKTRVSMEKDGILSGEVIEEKLEIDVGMGNLDSEPIIPGLSGGGPSIPGGFYGMENGRDSKSPRREDSGGGGGDDWESDSEDDLQIVLNEQSGPPIGMDRNQGMGSDDEDEEGDDLIIVADGGDQHHQAIEEQEWGDDSVQAVDRERKEVGEAAKVNGGMGSAIGGRIGYNNHVYHPHHSQFKYVRPGAAVIPGGAVVGPGGAPGQVRPPVNMGPIAGRGRGDWRPIGAQNVPAMQKNFHSGFGLPFWANNSSGRGFGGGSEFTLPSHKTVFDIDIDTIEEKPWRHPGVDISDFFNFGLDEEQWKAYCKQLEYHRLEATMQSKIRVYESGRSEQDYDPDLPPELAAAAAIHDASVENAHLGKRDGEQGDATGQGNGASRIRPPMPTGRAIQVEGGYGERLPSIDTKPPRIRDSDAIIEIVLQDSVDDGPITANGSLEQLGDHLEGGGNEETSRRTNTEGFDRFPQTYSGKKREMVGRREPFMDPVYNNIHEGDGILPFPPEAPLQYHPGSKGRTVVYPGGSFGTPHDGRWPPRTARDKYPAEHGNDVIPSQNVRINRLDGIQKEKSGESIDGKQIPESPSPVTVEAARETGAGHKVDVHDELALGDSSVSVEGEETAMGTTIPSDTLGDGSLLHSVKQKLSSLVEQPAVQDTGSGDDLRTTRSSDNSKARSGSSRDYQKRRDDGEEEVVQEGRSRRMGDVKRRRDEGENSFQRKVDYGRDGRQEMDRDRIVVKGREDSHHSYPYRDGDSYSTHPSRIKTRDIERPRERNNSVEARQKRDGDVHGRRVKEEDMRKRVYVEEMGSKHRSKVRGSERIENDEHLHSKKRLDNGDWRGRRDKDVGPRLRERDDNLMSRHENFDDAHTKRRKDEVQHQREKADKEVLHGYKAREDNSRSKRERDDGLDQRRREDQAKVRDKPDDHHSVRHRDESWRQRERDDRQRPKQPHEDTLSNREREGRGSERSVHGIEDKSWVGNARSKDASKGLVSEKDYQSKDNRRQSEQPKRSDRVEDDSPSQHRGRGDVYARENQFNDEDRNPRHERSSIHNDRSVNASDSQRMHKERRKENMNKESEGAHQHNLGSSKRKQEDHSAHRSKKVSMKAVSEHERGNVLTSAPTNPSDPGHFKSSSYVVVSKKSHHDNEVPQQRHSSKKRRENAPSDDEQQKSRKGRTKLERWTSHKDRDDNTTTQASSSLKAKEIGGDNNDQRSLAGELPDEPIMTLESVGDQHHLSGEDKNAGESEINVTGKKPTPGSRHVESDKVGDDRHLDTVAKLKKRSERFKTPMPIEKDSSTNKKMESEALVSGQSEPAADSEIKPERPARKRRWVSS